MKICDSFTIYFESSLYFVCLSHLFHQPYHQHLLPIPLSNIFHSPSEDPSIWIIVARRLLPRAYYKFILLTGCNFFMKKEINRWFFFAKFNTVSSTFLLSFITSTCQNNQKKKKGATRSKDRVKLLISRLSKVSREWRAGEKAPQEHTALAVGLWSARLVNVGQLTRWRHSDLCRALLPRQGERRGACAPRNTRNRDGAKGGGVRTRAQCEPLLSGTSARRRVQVVSCSFSTFLHDKREVFPPRLVNISLWIYPRRDIQSTTRSVKLRSFEGLKRRMSPLWLWFGDEWRFKEENFVREGWIIVILEKWWV